MDWPGIIFLIWFVGGLNWMASGLDIKLCYWYCFGKWQTTCCVLHNSGAFLCNIYSRWLYCKHNILTIKATVSILSPIAGYIADIKYGQYKVLKFSTQFMIAFEFFILTVWILLTSIANTTDYRFSMLVSFLSISMIGYSVARVFFNTNIIQFGIEQLRDEPTSKSDCYLIMVLFVEQLTE